MCVPSPRITFMREGLETKLLSAELLSTLIRKSIVILRNRQGAPPPLSVLTLHLTNYTESKPSVSFNGVTTFEIESGSRYYRVYLVKDEREENLRLPEAAKLAAFFNSKFFHETVIANSLPIPCGRFEQSFRIDDQNVSYLVFVTTFVRGRRVRELSENELCLIAEKLGSIHAITSSTMAAEFVRVIEENHANISTYQNSLEHHLLRIMEDAVEGELAHYFSLPHEVMPRLQAVTANDHMDMSRVPTDRVICHGRLTADNCVFRDGNPALLVDITEWENVHFGDVAFDLSHLIITSAEPSVRRNKYMTIFRSYYYSRVDQRKTNFQLSDLKRLFRMHHRQAVLLGIEPLLEMLTSSEADAVKREHSYRWESALEDAFEFATQDHMSDEEQCLFAK
ncbi:unnamed protein product [Cylicocyclus nassatus]|uniref:CHK kinase-like domain-containing protein n=1 Tax=Cylicocyclus nassatus TaxID=53992 RepID=A0AA36GIJ3_CYLNA|nr:unnamed protein product [Cylicocyclus nassatus]